jgi:hypothetical protein
LITEQNQYLLSQSNEWSIPRYSIIEQIIDQLNKMGTPVDKPNQLVLQYIEFMAHVTLFGWKWGSNLELIAFAIMKKRNIIVYSNSFKKLPYSSYNLPSQKFISNGVSTICFFNQHTIKINKYLDHYQIISLTSSVYNKYTIKSSINSTDTMD